MNTKEEKKLPFDYPDYPDYRENPVKVQMYITQ